MSENKTETADGKVVSMSSAVARQMAGQLGRATEAFGAVRVGLEIETVAEAVVLAQEQRIGRPLTTDEVREIGVHHYAVGDHLELIARKRAGAVTELCPTRRDLLEGAEGVVRHVNDLRDAYDALVDGDQTTIDRYRDACQRAVDFLEAWPSDPVPHTVTMDADYYAAHCEKAPHATPAHAKRDDDEHVTMPLEEFESLRKAIEPEALRALQREWEGEEAEAADEGDATARTARAFAERVFGNAAFAGPATDATDVYVPDASDDQKGPQ